MQPELAGPTVKGKKRRLSMPAFFISRGTELFIPAVLCRIKCRLAAVRNL
jgi:hypothetical protein